MGKLINVIRDKYSIIPNEVFWDKRLDYRSRGLLCTIFSLPNGWEFSVRGLVELVTQHDESGVSVTPRGEGDKAIRAAVHYFPQKVLERTPTKDNKGKFTGYDYKLNIPPVPPE